ncbi:MAG: thiol:disulfide interchange protein [Bacteroidetes bacterium]|nr:MAG: thiol:disulfide interchange protein [Bacteroidota bacterium]
MTHQNSETPSQKESSNGKLGAGKFWQVFWLTFLVVSLGYAWYSFYTPSNRIVWADNYIIAQQQAFETEKPIILFFTGKWCSPCRIMKRQVWADDQVMSIVNAGFIPVIIDVADTSAVQALIQYRVHVTPTTIIINPKGIVLDKRLGGISKDEFLEMLESVKISEL